MNATERVVDFICGVDRMSIPRAASDMARRAALDTIGVLLAGMRDPVAEIARGWIEAEGGTPVVGVPGTTLRTSLSNAAWLNGTAAHALDYDDSIRSMGGHPSSPLLAALLPAAEVEVVAGSDLLDAFVVGFEVECKLGRGIGPSHYARGFHSTATLGALGATAACARLWGLNRQQTSHALGIVASMAGGLRINFGSMTKPMGTGNAARAGVVAASLARRGFTGGERVLDGQIGLIRAFSPEDDGKEAAVNGFGSPWELLDPGISVKKYACGHASHQAIDAALALVHEHDIQPDDIERIEVHVPPNAWATSGGISPLLHSRPRGGLEGKFSMEYAVAAAILDRRLGVQTFQDEAVQRPEAQKLLGRVSIVRDDQRHPAADSDNYQAVEISFHANDRRLVQSVSEPRGSASSPLSWDELAEKFRDCASFALPPEAVSASLDLIEKLDDVRDLRELTTLLQVDAQ